MFFLCQVVLEHFTLFLLFADWFILCSSDCVVEHRFQALLSKSRAFKVLHCTNSLHHLLCMSTVYILKIFASQFFCKSLYDYNYIKNNLIRHGIFTISIVKMNQYLDCFNNFVCFFVCYNSIRKFFNLLLTVSKT